MDNTRIERLLHALETADPAEAAEIADALASALAAGLDSTASEEAAH